MKILNKLECSIKGHDYRQITQTYVCGVIAGTVGFKCRICNKIEERDNLYARCKNLNCNYEVYKPAGGCTKCGTPV